MKIALFNDYRIGVVSGDTIRDVSQVLGDYRAEWPWSFMLQFIARFDTLRERIESAAEQVSPVPLSQVKLRPPIPLPGKIVAAAANYNLHHQEMGGGSLQGEMFLKASSSVAGPGDTIQLPNVPGREVHYEAELAVVMGKQAKGLDESNALDAVFGYTCALDITVRGQGDRSRRKSYDTFTPIGPWIVTADEIPDPHALGIKLWRNDELRQDGNTNDLTYNIPSILRYTTSVMTLYPGDVLPTGTPQGVGKITDGDRLTIELERIGRMSLDVRGPAPGTRASEPNA